VLATRRFVELLIEGTKKGSPLKSGKNQSTGHPGGGGYSLNRQFRRQEDGKEGRKEEKK
jgi:hypothetical protein